jgi:carboxypeptidase family protein
MSAILAAFLCASLLLFAQTPSPPAQPSGQNAKPNGTIRGRILTPNGRPARRASVRMLAPTGGFPRTVAADFEGRYEFTEVAAGDYRISAGKPGYIVLEFGQQRAFEHGTVVTIRAGETLEKIDITLPASGAISGRILDTNGDAVEGIDVRLMQLRFAANRRRLLPVTGVGRRLTNDQGRYRLYGVPPGEYIVMAPIGDQPVPPASLILPPDYGSSYAPGTPNIADARVVTVGLAEQVDDVDMTLARGAVARISGVVVDSLGKPLRARILMSRSQRSNEITTEPSSTSSNADGSFEFRGVPSGEWVLQASTGGNVNKGQEGEFVSRFVTVDGSDVNEVRLQTSIGSRVTGRIVFEGSDAADPTSVTISTFPADFDFASLVGPGGRAIGQPDGTFALNGLSGPRRLYLMRGPPWSLKAVRVNGRDVTDEALPFGTAEQSLSDVEIILTNKAARIAGSVTDARGQAVMDYTAIVFATAADRWYQGSRFFTFTRPKADGAFAVADLPPAEYYVAAVDRLEGTEGFGEWQDPAFLESIAARATRVTLTDGQAASVALRVIVR